MKARLLAVLVLAGCTYAQVSATPVQLPDGNEGFMYSGRSNFGYQAAEADRTMAATCAARNGRPVIVEQSEQNIGAGAVLTGNTALLGANRQQRILFKCVQQ